MRNMAEAPENLFSILAVCGLAEWGSKKKKEYTAHESIAFG